jgi:2-acylglycerol O-acyltransferase 2
VRRLPAFPKETDPASVKSYFPISLVKTCDLPPDQIYIFGYHPHGIIGVGAMANFGSDATSFSKQFPGIRPHLLTLATNFQMPFYRDILLALGICSVSYKSCQNILRRGSSPNIPSGKQNGLTLPSTGPGNSITIVIGGAAEALSARPGTADLTLKKRLGFIKLAIREGAHLVPTFSFGENDLFEQLANQPGTKLRAIQKRFQRAFGFTLPIFFGRGVFNYSLGMMPYRHPIVSVGRSLMFVLLFARITCRLFEKLVGPSKSSNVPTLRQRC